MKKLTQEIIDMVNTILAPYGEHFTPGGAGPAKRKGFMNWAQASKYTSLSKSTLQRAVYAGKLKPPHKMGPANASALFAIEDLDEFILSH